MTIETSKNYNYCIPKEVIESLKDSADQSIILDEVEGDLESYNNKINSIGNKIDSYDSGFQDGQVASFRIILEILEEYRWEQT